MCKFAARPCSWLALLGLVAALVFSPQARAQNRSVLAVMPFEGIGVAVEDATALTVRVQEEVAALNKFTLVEQTQAAEFMKEAAFRQESCAGVSCAYKLGRSLGAGQVLSGTLTQQDGRWRITAELVDVAGGKSTTIDPVEQEGDVRRMLDRAPALLAAKLAQLTVSGPQPIDAPAEQSGPRPLRDMGSDEARTLPRKGFALYTGYAGYSGTAKMEDGSSVAYSGATIPSLGLEYQWVLNGPWALALFLEVSGGGKPEGKFSKLYNSGGPLLNGLELRYWKDNWYVGGNIAMAQTCFFDFASERHPVKDLCFHGTGYGPAAGYQFRNGWFVSGSYAHSELAADARPDDVRVPHADSAMENALWLNVGYRWGQT